jgi:TonB family protein
MAAVPGHVHAETYPDSLKQIGSWTLVANASSRSFHSCSMRRIQTDGFAIYIGLTAGGVQYFGTSAPQWDLKAHQTYPLSLKIGAEPFTFSGTAMSNDTLNVDAAPEFFAALQSGQMLSVAGNQRHFAMDLDGIEGATAGLRECMTTYKDRTVPIARMPSRPPPRSVGSSVTQEPSFLSILRDKGFTVKKYALPVYPASSRLASEEGTVYVKVRFPIEGGAPDVVSVERSSGHPALDKAATDALQQMHIEPYQKDGKSTPIALVVPMRFILFTR